MNVLDILKAALEEMGANGLAARMDRIKSIGNGQVPRVAVAAWMMLKP